MNTKLALQSVLIALGLFLAARSEAGCRKVRDCSQGPYNCVVRQLCENTYDLPDVSADPWDGTSGYQYSVKPMVDYSQPCTYGRPVVLMINGQWKQVCQ